MGVIKFSASCSLYDERKACNLEILQFFQVAVSHAVEHGRGSSDR
jgi:hypothetical protein